jgi:site-specific recombinase XerD
MSKNSAISGLSKARRRIALRVGNPRIAKIHYHLIRHFKGTTEYYKTHDMNHVRLILGHKSILNTQIYVNIEQMAFNDICDEYHVKVATTVETLQNY